jgi:hypothetical protein
LYFFRNWKWNPNYGAGNLTIRSQSKKAAENNVQMSGKIGVVVAAVAATATVESTLVPFNPNSE